MILLLITVLLGDAYLPAYSFMQISSAIYYSSFFIFGILYCDYKPTIDNILRKYWYASIILMIVSVSLCFNSYLAAFCGIGFSLILSLLLEGKCSDKLVELSGFTYTVFLLSYFPQMLIRGPIAHMFPQINQYVLSIISFLLGLSVPAMIGMIAIKIVERQPKMKHILRIIGL